MKMIIKLLFLISCIFAISCSNDDNQATTTPIKLSTNNVHLLAGEERIVTILSNLETSGIGKYGIESENPKIAVGTWKSNKEILIISSSVGESSIYVHDKRNPENDAEIKVVSNYLSGKYIENGAAATFIVQSNDLSVSETIENELREIALKRSGIRYYFDKETQSVEIDYSLSSVGLERKVGTYDWGKDYLNFEFDGNISKHGFAAINSHTIIFDIDFLEKYKREYPDAGVTYARLDSHLSTNEQ